MEEDKIKITLQNLLPKLAGINFVLLGTLNLKLQGLPLDPRDIDFLTDNEGVNKIAKIFGSKIIKDEDYAYIQTAFDFMGIEIHFASAELNLRPENFLDYVVNIEKYGLTIPCLSLESELETYEQMGREKDKRKIELLREMLNKKP
jgi:hypothetical protein